MTATNEQAGAAQHSGSGRRGRKKQRRASSLGAVGWWPAIVIAIVSLVDRIETSVLTGVLPLLQEEWGFSDTAGGAIPTAVTIAGLLVALPAGYLADRANRKNLLAVVVASWSVITLASGMATSFAMFFATRVVLGAADSIDTPSQSSLLGDYYPPEVRSLVFGVHRMVYFVGIGVGSLLGGAIGQIFGWRWAFWFMILPGLVVAWWCYRLREPIRGEIDRQAALRARAARAAEAGEQVPAPSGSEGLDSNDPSIGTDAPAAEGVPPEEPAPAATSATTSAFEGGWRAMVSQTRELFVGRTLRFLFGGVIVLFLGLNGIFYWLPTHFVREFDTGTLVGGASTAIIIIIGVPVGTLIGSLIDRRLHGVVRGVRVVAGGVGFTIGGILMAIGFQMPSLLGQVALLVLAISAMAVAIPVHFAAAADCMSHRNRGLGFTLLQVGTALGSSFGPLLVGWVSDRTETLQSSFYVLVIPVALAGLVVLGGRSSYEDEAAQVLEDSLSDQ